MRCKVRCCYCYNCFLLLWPHITHCTHVVCVRVCVGVVVCVCVYVCVFCMNDVCLCVVSTF